MNNIDSNPKTKKSMSHSVEKHGVDVYLAKNKFWEGIKSLINKGAPINTALNALKSIQGGVFLIFQRYS